MADNWDVKAQREISSERKTEIGIAYGDLPLSFMPNNGQTVAGVEFHLKAENNEIYFTDKNEIVFNAVKERDGELVNDVVISKFVGAKEDTRITGENQLGGIANFLTESSGTSVTNVPTFASIRYDDLYSGIDLIFSGKEGKMKRDLVVEPGADPSEILIDYENVKRLRIRKRDGALVVRTKYGRWVEDAPVAYQDIGGERIPVEANFILLDEEGNKINSRWGSRDALVGFEVGEYDPNYDLWIDPILEYSSYVGGGDQLIPTTDVGFDEDIQQFRTIITEAEVGATPGNSAGYAIAVDSAGAAYVAGETFSSVMPVTVESFEDPDILLSTNSTDIFVTKFNTDGTGVAYSTYIGGNDRDVAYAIAVDVDGSAYITGETESEEDNFIEIQVPQTLIGEQIQSQFGGGATDAFITKLNPTGTEIDYSTYIGGSGSEKGLGIALDNNSSAYIVGSTSSTDFPTTLGAFQTTNSDNSIDAFVTKINSDGTAILYSSYVGGGGFDEGSGIVVDGTGEAYITGITDSSDWPTNLGAFRTTLAGGSDVFITKLNADGSNIEYSTYIGGSGFELAGGIDIDNSGAAYITGMTPSTDFPTTSGAFQEEYGGGTFDAFITKLLPDGTALDYSTFIGGSGNEGIDFLPQIGSKIAVDRSGSAYIVGSTTFSETLSISPPADDPAPVALGEARPFPIFTPGEDPRPFGGGNTESFTDSFITKIAPDGDRLIYSSFWGGDDREEGYGIALDRTGAAYITGLTFSTQSNISVNDGIPVLDDSGDIVTDDNGNPIVQETPRLDANGNPILVSQVQVTQVPIADDELVDANGNPLPILREIVFLEERPLLDADGNPILDVDGNLIRQEVPITETFTVVDGNGNPILDGSGNPIQQEVARVERVFIIVADELRVIQDDQGNPAFQIVLDQVETTRDENGDLIVTNNKFILDSNGNLVSDRDITVIANDAGELFVEIPVLEEIFVQDSNGNPIQDANGNFISVDVPVVQEVTLVDRIPLREPGEPQFTDREPFPTTADAFQELDPSPDEFIDLEDRFIDINDRGIIQNKTPDLALFNREDAFITKWSFESAIITEFDGRIDVTEGSPVSDSYTLQLSIQPTADVVISIEAPADVQATTDSDTSTVTFTPNNWNIPQEVQVTSVDDPNLEGPHTSTISHSIDSTDPNYQAVAVGDVIVNIADDEFGILVSSETTPLITSEAGDSAEFTVALGNVPSANVIIPIATSDVGEGLVSGGVDIDDPDAATEPSASIELVFTPDNWDVPQAVTVTGVDDVDETEDGDEDYIIEVGPAVSDDLNYDNLDAPDVSVTNIEFSISVSPITGLITTEAGGTDEFTIVLGKEPTADVMIPIESSNIEEGTVSPEELVFNPSNWDNPQTVTVTGVDDGIDDGDVEYTIALGPAESDDNNYDGQELPVVEVTNLDLNSPPPAGAPDVIILETASGPEVTALESTDVTEGGTSDTYMVVLNSPPSDNNNVEITIVIPDEETITAPVMLTFTPDNWNEAQTVTVAAVNDQFLEGPHQSTINHIARSSDPDYNEIDIDPITVNVTDSAGVIIESEGSIEIAEDGDSDTYSLTLTREPTADVTIEIEPDNQSITSPTSVTFTPDNWDMPQTVVVAAVNDQVVEENHTSNITHTVTSADRSYNGVAVANVTANISEGNTVASPGITITESGGSTSIAENGSADTYMVVLDARPSADVKISIAPGDGESFIALNSSTPASGNDNTEQILTFTSANWNVPQMVTVFAVNDLAVESSHRSTITHAVSSTDSNYDRLGIPNVIATITDNDVISDNTFSLDIDGNGVTDAFTDGFLLLRYEFGFRGNALIDGAIGSGAMRPNAASIEAYLEGAGTQLDFDGNGSIEALKDGIMALRHLFGFTGNDLVNGLLGSDATRNGTEIEALLQSYDI